MSERPDELRLPDPLPGVERVAVLGLGRSGLAAAAALARAGKSLLLSDEGAAPDRAALPDLPADRLEVVTGALTLGDAQAAVISPGIPISHAIVKAAHLASVPLIAELDLGARLCPTPTLAITGTDGKTTTTLLCAHLLRAAGLRVCVAGNIGTPLCACLDEATAADWLVLEVSAFQLWSAPTFTPRVLIATNVADDHLDYFAGDRDYYAATKRRPLERMGRDATVVLNADDPTVRAWSHLTQAQLAWYAHDAAALPPDAARWGCVRSGALVVDGASVLDLARLPLRGVHNQANALAALLGVRAAAPEAASAAPAALAAFAPPPHRIEPVGQRGRVAFFNDSKATNPHAASAALRALDPPLVLIAGGVDKGLDLDAWIEVMRGRVAALVLIGAIAPRLARAVEAAGLDVPVILADDLARAVAEAEAAAVARDAPTVLLSPGCSSFDMFTSYSARGDAFRRLVADLPHDPTVSRSPS